MLLRKIYTLVFLQKDCQLLLGWKKRGFGVNKWNGFGGKLELNETILEAAARELKEECCVTVKPSDLKNIGHLEFTFEGEPLMAFEGEPVMMDVRVFTTSTFEGVPMETEEMTPKWFKHDELPFDQMWPDDRIWFPYMLKGKCFSAKFHFQGYDTILRYDIEELESMEAFYAKNTDLALK